MAAPAKQARAPPSCGQAGELPNARYTPASQCPLWSSCDLTIDTIDVPCVHTQQRLRIGTSLLRAYVDLVRPRHKATARSAATAGAAEAQSAVDYLTSLGFVEDLAALASPSHADAVQRASLELLSYLLHTSPSLATRLAPAAQSSAPSAIVTYLLGNEVRPCSSAYGAQAKLLTRLCPQVAGRPAAIVLPLQLVAGRTTSSARAPAAAAAAGGGGTTAPSPGLRSLFGGPSSATTPATPAKRIVAAKTITLSDLDLDLVTHLC